MSGGDRYEPDVAYGVNASMALAIGPQTGPSLVIPAGLVNDAVVGAQFVLPEARAYLFDLTNAGTIDDAGHTAKLDMLLQVLLPDGVTWNDALYVQAANRTVRRIVAHTTSRLEGTGSVSGGTGTFVTSLSSLKNTGTSTNGVSVVPNLAEGGLLQIPVFFRTYRLIGVGRTASPTVGDTISLTITALTDPRHYLPRLPV